MVSEQQGVAAKIIATVDDLEAIAADDEADVPALDGWRRELFGEQALALKHGRLALAVENGRVVGESTSSRRTARKGHESSRLAMRRGSVPRPLSRIR